jgi:hypothetical protein
MPLLPNVRFKIVIFHLGGVPVPVKVLLAQLCE